MSNGKLRRHKMSKEAKAEWIKDIKEELKELQGKKLKDAEEKDEE